MLYEEAQWVGNRIQQYFKAGDSILNLGSSTSDLREVRQSHMCEFIFEPTQKAGIHIVHTDIATGEGVDIVGDLTDPMFLEELKKKNWNGLLCCNLLEHLVDRQPIVNAISDLLKTGDKLIITVPFNYPYHLDPIDTLYRPSISELKELFSKLQFIKGEELIARRKVSRHGKPGYHKNYFQQLKNDPPLFINLLIRCLLPFYKPKMWYVTVKDLCRMFKPFKVTCVVFQRL